MKWIPIVDNWPYRGHLPASNVDVLVSMDDEVYMAHLTDSGDWNVHNVGIFPLLDVDAWGPKPKPYRG